MTYPFLDNLSKFLSSASDSTSSLQRDFENLARAQAESFLSGMVKREELETLRGKVEDLRSKNEALSARLEKLESKKTI